MVHDLRLLDFDVSGRRRGCWPSPAAAPTCGAWPRTWAGYRCRGYAASLRRTRCGRFTASEALAPEDLAPDRYVADGRGVLPVGEALAFLPAYHLDERRGAAGRERERTGAGPRPGASAPTAPRGCWVSTRAWARWRDPWWSSRAPHEPPSVRIAGRDRRSSGRRPRGGHRRVRRRPPGPPADPERKRWRGRGSCPSQWRRRSPSAPIRRLFSGPRSLPDSSPPWRARPRSSRGWDWKSSWWSSSTGTSPSFHRPISAQHVLSRRLGARLVLVGENFRFGHGASGGPADLREYGRRHDFDTQVVALSQEGGETISSTRIRRLVSAGHVAEAARLLGRPHRIEGLVVAGAGRGRTLAAPTANLAVEPETALPRQGVYVTRSILAGGALSFLDQRGHQSDLRTR